MNKKPTYQIITFGCKLNQAESNMMAADLNLHGFKKSEHQPQTIIVNLCAVTQKAVKEGRQKIHQLRRKYPRAKIIATGCVAESNWPGVDKWVKKEDILKSTYRLINPAANYRANHQHKLAYSPSLNKNDRNRVLIKIQTGCNNFCSYCIVPFTRGSRLVDTPIKEVVKQILAKEKQGFKEVVLTGVNIGLYGQTTKAQEAQKTQKHLPAVATRPALQAGKNKKNNLDLVNLLKVILKETNIQRIRLGSIWPTHISPELIKLYSQEPRLCPHFHLSIQSGSNKILKLMNRRYTVGEIKSIVKKCRTKIPHINFTTDIIVGFPGETERDFQASAGLIQKIGFSKVHIFKYSPRPNTRAAEFDQQINIKIKQQRSRELIKLAEQVAQRTKQKFIGARLPILWEQRRAGYYYGFTNNYIRVKKKARPGRVLENQIEVVKLSKNLLV